MYPPASVLMFLNEIFHTLMRIFTCLQVRFYASPGETFMRLQVRFYVSSGEDLCLHKMRLLIFPQVSVLIILGEE